jgi:DNA-binding MurR/RpiR family transcriptional regulator
VRARRSPYRRGMEQASAPIPDSIRADDAPPRAAAKLTAAAIMALAALEGSFADARFAQAVERIAQSRRIDIFGDHESQAVVQEAQARLARLGFIAVASVEPEPQLMAAGRLIEDDLVLVLPASRRLTALQAAITRAKASGATVIAIVEASSALGAMADLVVPVPPLATGLVEAPMTQRLMLLCLFEALAVGVMLRLCAMSKAAAAQPQRPASPRRVVISRRGVAEELDLTAAPPALTGHAYG